MNVDENIGPWSLWMTQEEYNKSIEELKATIEKHRAAMTPEEIENNKQIVEKLRERFIEEDRLSQEKKGPMV